MGAESLNQDKIRSQHTPETLQPELRSINYEKGTGEGSNHGMRARTVGEILADPISMEELRSSRRKFDESIKIDKTFQELIWHIQEEQYWRTLPDVELALGASHTQSSEQADITQLKKGGYILSDSGKLLRLEDLKKELRAIEAEHQYEQGEVRSVLPDIKSLNLQMVKLRTDRKILESEYRNVHPTEIVTGGSALHVYAIGNESLSKVRTVKDATPILVSNGFSVNHSAAEKVLIGLAEKERLVITSDVEPTATDFDSGTEFPKDTTRRTKTYATALSRTMDVGDTEIFDGAQRYDAIGYSIGAISLLTAAVAEPERFRNIVLVDPAGLTDLDTSYFKRFMQLIQRSKLHKVQSLRQADIGEEGDIRFKLFHENFSNEMKKELRKGGLPFIVLATDTIAKSNLVNLMIEAQSKGIGVSVLMADEDALFPKEEMERHALRAGSVPLRIQGGHANVGFSPALISDYCIRAFDSMRDDSHAAEDNSVEAEVG